MLKILAIIIELFASIFVLWVLTLLSTLLHEFGHAIGYMLATGDRHWHIRVGWGKRLLNTKALTVNLLVFDGFFTPSGKEIEQPPQSSDADSPPDKAGSFFTNGP